MYFSPFAEYADCGRGDMNYLLILLLVCQFDWDAAEKQARLEKAQSAAFDTMRTDTTVCFTKKQPVTQTTRHTVTVNDHRIDSIDAIIDSLKKQLYSDNQYRKMRDFDIANRIAFFNHLLHYKIKDTAQVTIACNALMSIYDLEYRKLLLIMESEQSDVRATIQLYIRKNRDYTGLIGGYLYSILK